MLIKQAYRALRFPRKKAVITRTRTTNTRRLTLIWLGLLKIHNRERIKAIKDTMMYRWISLLKARLTLNAKFFIIFVPFLPNEPRD